MNEDRQEALVSQLKQRGCLTMKTVRVYDRYFTFGYRDFNLTLAQRLKLRILGELKIFTDRPSNWTGKPGNVPFFIVKCSLHGLFLEYQHGNDEKLVCPRCFDDAVSEFERRTGQNLKGGTTNAKTELQ